MKAAKTLFLALAVMMMAACSTDDAQEGAPKPTTPKQKISLSISRGEATSRTTVTEEGDRLACSWQAGDKIYVLNVSKHSADGTLSYDRTDLVEMTTSNSGSVASFSGSVTDGTTWEAGDKLSILYPGTLGLQSYDDIKAITGYSKIESTCGVVWIDKETTDKNKEWGFKDTFSKGLYITLLAQSGEKEDLGKTDIAMGQTTVAEASETSVMAKTVSLKNVLSVAKLNFRINYYKDMQNGDFVFGFSKDLDGTDNSENSKCFYQLSFDGEGGDYIFDIDLASCQATAHATYAGRRAIVSHFDPEPEVKENADGPKLLAMNKYGGAVYVAFGSQKMNIDRALTLYQYGDELKCEKDKSGEWHLAEEKDYLQVSHGVYWTGYQLDTYKYRNPPAWIIAEGRFYTATVDLIDGSGQ